MLLINDLICNKCIISIICRNNDFHRIFSRTGVIIHYIAQLRKNNTSYLLFYDLVYLLLQLHINRQVHIIACSWLHIAYLIGYLPHAVHIKNPLSPVSLENIIHGLLNA